MASMIWNPSPAENVERPAFDAKDSQTKCRDAGMELAGGFSDV